MLHLVFRNILAVVADCYHGLIALAFNLQEDHSTRRRELEGVREDVYNHLIELPTVYPDRQLLVIVLVDEVDALGLSLMLEQRVEVLYEGDEIGFGEVHLHHTLVNLSQVHELVDEAQDSLSVSLDGLIDAQPSWVVFLSDER